MKALDLANQVQWTALQDDEGQAFVPGTFLWALDQYQQGRTIKRGVPNAICYNVRNHLLSVREWCFAVGDWEVEEEPSLAQEIASINQLLADYGGDAVEHLKCPPQYEQEVAHLVSYEDGKKVWSIDADAVYPEWSGPAVSNGKEWVVPDPREKWRLEGKDRATESLRWARVTDAGIITTDEYVMESSEGMYWLPVCHSIYMSKDATTDEWERAVKEQIEEFRKKHDPGYYVGDFGDAQDEPDEVDEHPVYGRPITEQAVEPKCECGSEKAKVPGHSTWCPVYNDKDSKE